jgi:hypothetical protein
VQFYNVGLGENLQPIDITAEKTRKNQRQHSPKSQFQTVKRTGMSNKDSSQQDKQ